MVVEKINENPKVPYIYLDTSFIIDLSVGKSLACSIIEEIKKNNWKYCCSVFGVMECLDIRQENLFFIRNIGLGNPVKDILHKRRERDLSDKELDEVQKKLVNTVLRPHKIDYGFMFDFQGWNNCLKLVRESNINSSDAIHFVTAVALNCDILLSSDDHFINEGNKYLAKISVSKLKLCRPDQFYDVLKEKGY